MKIFKKNILVIFLFFTISSLYAIGIEISGKTGNSIISQLDEFKKIPDVGFNFLLKEDLGKNIIGSLAIQREPCFGNTIWGRIAYTTDWMQISIGPSLGFLNSNKLEKEFTALFQPGFGTSMSFRTPIGFLLAVDTNFGIPLVQSKNNSIYLQDGYLEMGWNFPNIKALLKISQKTKIVFTNQYETNISCTDMGFYAVAFSKPSRFRIPINVFFRLNNYKKISTNTTKDSTGSIFIESGIEHSISSEFEWFINAGASIFSFSLTKNGETLNKFLFNIEAGVRFTLGE